MAYSIDLSGRIAFITGASGGLGAQFARTLSAAGAAVVLASRRIDKLKDLRGVSGELESLEWFGRLPFGQGDEGAAEIGQIGP